MTGPERLEIPQLPAYATRQYRVIERIIGKPDDMHSMDWIAFFDELGSHDNIERQWIRCADEAEVRQKLDDVEATCRFRKARNFEVFYCSPRELERATGEKPPAYEAIEDFGRYVKLLSIRTGSFTSGEKPNTLLTIFKCTDPAHERLMNCMLACCKEMNKEWFDALSGQKTDAAGSPR